MSEIIVADEIIKLETTRDHLINLLRRLRNNELSEKVVLEIINDNSEVKRYFLIEVMEIIRDELRFSRLTDFLDGYGNFGVKYNLSELLEKVIRGIELRLENLRRRLEWR